jgi:hypothetical protein
MVEYTNIDYKRNNKVALRNFSESCDYHDIVKTLLVRMLRRKNKSNKIAIYTEFDPAKPNEDYPDICMIIKEHKICFELQKEITKEWEQKVIEKYKDVDLIIVPLKKLSTDLNKLKIQLKEYIV